MTEGSRSLATSQPDPHVAQPYLYYKRLNGLIKFGIRASRSESHQLPNSSDPREEAR